MSEIHLSSPPADGVSNVVFGRHTPDSLLVSSWDNTVRLYNTTDNVQVHQYSHKAAVLDACFGRSDSQCFSGSVDRSVRVCDLSTGVDSHVGSHDNSVKAVAYLRGSGVLVTGSWDCSMKVWDTRLPEPCVHTLSLPDKVYTMDATDDRVVIGMNNRHVFIVDARNLTEPEQQRESSLKNQTRCVRCYAEGHGFALSTIEGRVAMEFFDSAPEVQAKKYAFKCHRVADKAKNLDIVYPVNAIAFHPTFGTFATGGCDSNVIMWDGINRRRLQQPWKYNNTIAALSFNCTGQALAIAASYTFEEGEKEHAPDAIIIKSVTEADVKPRPKA